MSGDGKNNQPTEKYENLDVSLIRKGQKSSRHANLPGLPVSALSRSQLRTFKIDEKLKSDNVMGNFEKHKGMGYAVIFHVVVINPDNN